MTSPVEDHNNVFRLYLSLVTIVIKNKSCSLKLFFMYLCQLFLCITSEAKKTLQQLTHVALAA